MEQKKVCIIGSGPSGISSINSFLESQKKGEKIPQITCYEKQSNWGGLWNYTHKTGVTEYGEPVHGSMYRHLWINAPKEVLEFPDYTFKDHFKKNLPSFTPREIIFDYLSGRAEKKKIRERITFNRSVKNCRFDEEKNMFVFISHDNLEDLDFEEEFDFVICATGHLSTPNLPFYKVLDDFSDRVLHSYDFLNAEEFVGKDIMIIETSYSAEDIASQCFKYEVKSVTISLRTKKMDFTWQENFSNTVELNFVKKIFVFLKMEIRRNFIVIFFALVINIIYLF